jgi:predicted secreted protein
VELLTHPSYILQIERLRPERKTKLEKFLSFFDQSQKTDDNFILEIDENNIDPDFEEIAKLLNMASQDEEMIDKLLAEEDIENAFDTLEHNLQEAQKQAKEERLLKEEERKLKEEAQLKAEEAQQKLIELVKFLLSLHIPIPEIAEKTQMPEDEIRKLME